MRYYNLNYLSQLLGVQVTTTAEEKGMYCIQQNGWGCAPCTNRAGCCRTRRAVFLWAGAKRWCLLTGSRRCQTACWPERQPPPASTLPSANRSRWGGRAQDDCPPFLAESREVSVLFAISSWPFVRCDVWVLHKLQALVCDILPATTAVINYAVSLPKLLAYRQFFISAQMAVTLKHNSAWIRHFFYNCPHY